MIKVYVYNTQNATPDVQAQVNAARKAGIAIATVTEQLGRPSRTGRPVSSPASPQHSRKLPASDRDQPGRRAA